MAAARLDSKPCSGRKINVKCIDNVVRTGFLYTLDPLSNTLVIVNRVVLCDRENRDESKPGIFEHSRKGPNKLLENENDTCKYMDCKRWCLRFEIIMGDAYTVIEDIDESCDSDAWSNIEKTIMQQLEPCDAMVNTELDSQELKSKMDSVVGFFKSHHLPLTIHNDLIVLFDGLVKIGPPYTSASCVSRNSVVLDKVHQLLEQFSCIET